MRPTSIALFATLAVLPVRRAPEPVLSWRIAPEHLTEGAFEPQAGALVLELEGSPSWIGEGPNAALLRAANAPALTPPARVTPEQLPSDELSLEAWVAVDRPQEWGGFLCAIEDNGSYERGWLIGYRGNRFCFALATEGSGSLTYLTAPHAYQNSRWYHVVGTYDGKRQRLFVDGALVAEGGTQSGAVRYHSDHVLAVGSYLDENEDYRMAGALHSIAVFDDALSEREVRRRHGRLRGTLPPPDGASFSGVTAPQSSPLAVLQPRINAAIDAGVEHLLRTQLRDGSWGYLLDKYRNGATSLALYALLEAGVRPDHPASSAALNFLSAVDPARTYSAGCQLLALGATEDPEHALWARRIVERLLDWESHELPGGWAYPSGAVDISNTQFAALGFWGASKLGVGVPADVWQRMVRRVVEEHQPNITELPWSGADANRSGARRIGGYTYFAGGATYPESGSMTTAGLCVLGLAESVLGKKLGTRFLRMSERSKPLALGWLDVNYSVSTNPGYPSTVYYYLYGLERVGALLELELLGIHPWYRDGAEWLLGQQEEDGGWGRHDQTAFALLFLTRATSAVITGHQVKQLEGVWSTRSGEVHIRATEGSPFAIWLTGFSEERAALHENADPARSGIFVRRVRWMVDGEQVAVVEGDPLTPWTVARFPTQHQFKRPGAHSVQALVELVEPGRDPRHLGTPVVVSSEELSVKFKISPEAWMGANNERAGDNLLRGVRLRSEVSSGGADASSALDGLAGTAWSAGAEDLEPRVRLDLDEPVRADRLLLWPADASLHQRGAHAKITRMSVSLNGNERVPLEALIPEEPLDPILVRFPRALPVRLIDIRVLGWDGPGAVGFSEVELRREK